ncbi:GNAT family N-acetyltransferase [Acidovorax sp. sic0104]|uniref:GNAT family N-acetyltransferase n=1 Tax=Acidovorax sp. sic0104 TaxID=2854784 RepID=UPI001C437E56|nr:GNAT family N-acetyltransferase [Acidovorax sp. sic0104]MBV7542350.1 GNAT family N-acetyltransferase [Acidovorax sp. sic0104]
MSLSIRPAQPGDAAAIARIHVAAWQAAYAGIIDEAYLAALSAAQREAYWAKAIAQGDPEVLLAQDDGQGGNRGDVAGWIALGDCRDPGAPAARGEVWAIYVDPARWSRGLGHALWQHARERLQARGKSEASLWVLAANAQARGFYTRQGFAPESNGVKNIAVAGATLQELRYTIQLPPSRT